MKLEVPYYSQYLDVTDPYWMPRACGFASMKMVLDFYNIEAPSVTDLAKEALEKGGYGKSGLIHDYVVSYFKSKGLVAERAEGLAENDLARIISHLENNSPLIVSVSKKILGQNKFHQVVLTGFEKEGNDIKGFYFNDPETLDKEANKNKFVSKNDFLESWRGMAIFISK